ncbi:hypothetical protein [Paracoccus sp. (in: a-proteobacteria)]|uniref:hypothetical protein n=1 Tax=Paracoccus sp. TaxID=267 RepID=UPI0028AC855E|nr:hypothetical protein [Paracoccus sp. (in: a-proteobacteria)]
MAIKTVLENLDGIDDAVKSLYVEKDGKFILDLEGVDAHPDVANLKSAYERVKAKEAEARTEAKTAKDDLAAALKGKPDEAALIAERQRLETERDEWKGKAEKAEGQLTGVTRDQALTEALGAAGITDPGLQKGAAALLRDQIKMVDGKPVVETDMGPKALADHAKHWAASEGKAFVTPPAGGGAGGSQSQNGGKIAGNMGGTREERTAALKAKFPDLQ